MGDLTSPMRLTTYLPIALVGLVAVAVAFPSVEDVLAEGERPRAANAVAIQKAKPPVKPKKASPPKKVQGHKLQRGKMDENADSVNREGAHVYPTLPPLPRQMQKKEANTKNISPNWIVQEDALIQETSAKPSSKQMKKPAQKPKQLSKLKKQSKTSKKLKKQKATDSSKEVTLLAEISTKQASIFWG